MATTRDRYDEIVYALEMLPEYMSDIDDSSLVLPRGLEGLADNENLLKGLVTFAVNSSDHVQQCLFLMLMNSASNQIADMNTAEDMANDTQAKDRLWCFVLATHIGWILRTEDTLTMPLSAVFAVSRIANVTIPEFFYSIFKHPDQTTKSLKGKNPYDQL